MVYTVIKNKHKIYIIELRNSMYNLYTCNIHYTYIIYKLNKTNSLINLLLNLKNYKSTKRTNLKFGKVVPLII